MLKFLEPLEPLTLYGCSHKPTIFCWIGLILYFWDEMSSTQQWLSLRSNQNVHIDQKETNYASFFEVEVNIKYSWIPYNTLQN